MGIKICRSWILLVGGLSITIFLGLIWPSPTSAAAKPLQPAVEDTSGQPTRDVFKPGELENMWRVLAVFLILSGIIESALTPLFNWRVFLAHTHNKGLRTPITMAFAFLIVWGYNLDIVRDLLAALGESVSPRIGGQVLTAFLLAGGSSGINKLLQTWKIRLSDDERDKRVTK